MITSLALFDSDTPDRAGAPDRMVGHFIRMHGDLWVGSEHQPALTTPELIARLTDVLTSKPPPTPEERAINVGKELDALYGNHWDWSLAVPIIAQAIKYALDADREAR